MAAVAPHGATVRTLAGGSLRGIGCRERTSRQKSCRDLRTKRKSCRTHRTHRSTWIYCCSSFSHCISLRYSAIIPTWVISSWFLADRLTSRLSSRACGSGLSSQGRLVLSVNVVLNLEKRKIEKYIAIYRIQQADLIGYILYSHK